MAPSIAESLGLPEPRFASPAERKVLAALERDLAEVELRLTADLAVADPVVDAVARYLKDAGGKRVRPMLLLLAAQLGDPDADGIVAAAEVVEITHLASLYHDDVMDDSDTRRGVASAHEVWGNSVAILAGDLLFARAGMLTAPLGEEVATLQSRTFERLCLGQLHETLGPGDADPIEHYIGVLADKTGSLIAAAAEVGALVAGADPAHRAALSEYGERIGIAFQLIDDIIDLSSDPATGKPAGTDVRAGVATLPLLHLRAATDDASRDLLARLTEPSDDASFAVAVDELSRHEAADRTRREAAQWQDSAIDALRALPRGVVRRGLEQFARSMVTRTK